MTPDPPLSDELNVRESIGRRLRIAAMTVVGAPLALVLVVPYLSAARAGFPDRDAPKTMAAVAVSMALMPLLVLLVLHLAGVTAKSE